MLASVAIAVLMTTADGTSSQAVAPPRTSVELNAPELRLLGGAFHLKLNSGWFRTAPTDELFARGSFDMEGSVSLRDRGGRLRIAGGSERSLMLRIVWTVRQDSEMVRVHSQVDLALLGRTFTLSPPDVRVRPRIDNGLPGVDVSVPILEGSF